MNISNIKAEMVFSSLLIGKDFLILKLFKSWTTYPSSMIRTSLLISAIIISTILLRFVCEKEEE